MTRLCIIAARRKLKNKSISKDKSTHLEIEKINVDGVSLIRKVAELLESTSEKDTEKIIKIKGILEE